MSGPHVTLECLDGRRLAAKPEGTFAVVKGAACPKCERTPLLVHGQGKRVENRDTYRTDAVCWSCGAPVGVLRAKVDTLFGIEEDEAMAELVRSKGIKVY